MTPEQFEKLLSLLESVLSKQYTLTGAADWPILAALGGVLMALVAFMWVDLKNAIKGDRSDTDRKIQMLKEDCQKDRDKLWEAFGKCQDDCCPKGRKE